MPPPAISTRGARLGSSLFGIGIDDGSGVVGVVDFVELELLSLAGASATALAATTRGEEEEASFCCCDDDDEEAAATRVEEGEEGDERRRTRGERIVADERHPVALPLEAADAERPVAAAAAAAAGSSDIALALRVREGGARRVSGERKKGFRVLEELQKR